MLRMIKSQYSIFMVLISLSLSVCASEMREQPCIDVHAAPDYDGNTPLHKACSTGNMELVRALLARGACVNSTNKFGDTPLHRAIENKHADIALELLARDDINVNCYNHYRDTPLHRATFHGLIPVIEKLMAKGADINARGSHDDTPLHITVENEYLDVFTKLLSYAGIDVNVANIYGDTPLHRAASLFRRHEFIPLLLAHGAQVNSVNGLNRTPLFCAVLNERYESVVLLSCVAGIDPNIAGMDYFEDPKRKTVSCIRNISVLSCECSSFMITPLCLAFEKSGEWTSKIPGVLLSIPGIDVNKRCSRGKTPLMYAMIGGHYMSAPFTGAFKFQYDAIKLLLQNKDVDVNATDEDRCTALHYAVLSDWAEYTVPLLARCPSLRVDIRNSSGHTALGIAQSLVDRWQRDFSREPKVETYIKDIEIEKQRAIDMWLRGGEIEISDGYSIRGCVKAFAQALHPRLGEKSPASCLDGFVLRDIAQLLKDEYHSCTDGNLRLARRQAVVEIIKYRILS